MIDENPSGILVSIQEGPHQYVICVELARHGLLLNVKFYVPSRRCEIDCSRKEQHVFPLQKKYIFFILFTKSVNDIEFSASPSTKAACLCGLTDTRLLGSLLGLRPIYFSPPKGFRRRYTWNIWYRHGVPNLAESSQILRGKRCVKGKRKVCVSLPV